MVHAMLDIYLGNQIATDEQLLEWLEHPDDFLTFMIHGSTIKIQLCTLEFLAASIPFVANPSKITRAA
jgi:hypothetical protein